LTIDWDNMQPHRMTLWAVLLAVPLAAGAGTPWTTQPRGPDAVAELMARAIRVVHERVLERDRVEGEPIVFNLPTGTLCEVYQDVIKHLGAARPMANSSEEAIHVMEVRVRGAEVDVISHRGRMQEMTVALSDQRAVVRLGRSGIAPPAATTPGVEQPLTPRMRLSAVS
jgi:hypothetical protein